MSFLLSVLLLTTAGYALAILCRVSQNHLIVDIALGWFLGSGFHALMSFFLAYLLHARVSALTSLGIVALPIVIVVITGWKRHMPRILASVAEVKRLRYLPRKHLLVYVLLSALAIMVFVLIVLHGKNTPTNTDDAVRLRAYTPILVYQNNFSDHATRLILSNGIWPSFAPVLSWQLQGGVNHFHVNYLVLTNVFFFVVLVYLLPTVRDRPEQGVWNAFLILSVPLFIYHSTSTYAETLYGIPLALSFLFFTFYVQDKRAEDLRGVWLLLALTSFSKSEGEIVAVTSAGVVGGCVIYDVFRKNKPVAGKEWWFVTPLAVYVSWKNALSGNPLINLLAAKMRPEGSGELVASIPPGMLGRASGEFWHSLFSSGNFGILFYVVGVSIVCYSRHLLQSPLRWPLVTLLILFIETYVNAVYVTPQYTVDQSTIHRSVIVLALASALFVAAVWESKAFPKERTPDVRTGASPRPSVQRETETGTSPAARPAIGASRRKRRRVR